MIQQAALQAFYLRGYHGTSIRDIASATEMTPASLYHHFANKQDILRVVMTKILREALASTRVALASAGEDPEDQLRSLVRAWVAYHALRQVEAKVGLSELNSLDAEGRGVVVALRDQQERMFRDVVSRGVEQGIFETAHPIEAARAVVNMGTAIATWFRPDGPIAVGTLAETYSQLALATVEVAERVRATGGGEVRTDVM